MSQPFELPVIDVSKFLAGDVAGSIEECKALAESLREFGCVVVKDPRVTEDDNNNFVDLLERYFEQDYNTKMKDARPELGYQVGVTPDGVEVPRDHKERIEKCYVDMCRPIVPMGPDPKWRFFWRIGERPTETKFEELNAPPVVPEAFSQWQSVMDKWGQLMVSSVTLAAEMFAVGLGLDQHTFSRMMQNAPHLLAPTGSDLSKHNKVGEVLAGYHYDLNFLTIHGKSRYPALNIFLRDASSAPRKKMQVKVPDGCLLIQAGKQAEWLTGGYVQAGYHEVVILDATVQRIEESRKSGKSLWRVSSTLFGHIASDQVLEPIGKFQQEANASNYPPTLAGEYVGKELEVIKLSAGNKEGVVVAM